MKILCEITTPHGNLRGEMEAEHAHGPCLVTWTGATELRRSPLLRPLLREMPAKLSGPSFISCAQDMARDLGGSVAIEREGLWPAMDKIIA